jgi:hypothetical protein
MPQETNLNVSPYFDDFNEEKNFNRVLFKPGIPVQARELTQLQTILQNQIEKFGKHFFKEGSMVIPGQIGYDSLYYSIELEDTFLGIPISEYLDKLVGKKIRGEISGVEATVVNHITATQSERGHNTLYVKYSKSGNDFTTNVFNDGENLITSSDIEYGISRVIANNPFATTLALNAASIGSAATIQEGVYFIRGYFVKVSNQTVIIDQYSNNPSYRVGLFIDENVVSAFDDSTLFDNAAGFSNFAAPGADRFQVKPTLIKKDLDDLSDANFIELLRLDNGAIQRMVKKTDYNLLADEFARRTYDESGNYYVKQFGVQVRESLNDLQGNNGVYTKDQKTSQGNVPSSDSMILQVSPGKAYVRGYEIEKQGNNFIDVEKPRTIKKLENQVFAFDKVSKIKVNRVYGTPFVGMGVDGTYVVQLRGQRTGATHSSAATGHIGDARVYDYKLESTVYTGVTSVYELFLWDIQTFTTITINSNLTAPEGSLIEGQRSGARGFLKTAASGSTSLTMTSTSGNFIVDEPIKVNGVNDTKTVLTVTEFSIDDVKSIYQQVSGSTFNADTVLSREGSPAPAGTEYSITTGGTCTVAGNRFSRGIKINDIVKYQKSGETDPTFNRVSAINVNGSQITLVALGTDVAGVCQKELPSGSTLVTSDFKIVRPQIIDAKDSSFVSDMPASAISSLDLSSSEITTRQRFTFTSTNGSATVTITSTNEFFESFDEERYNVSFTGNGGVQTLREENLVFSADRKSVTLRQLSQSAAGVFTATVKRTEVKSQKKTLNRCKKLIINRSQKDGSGDGQNTLGDGLTTNNVYGTRVQDKEICLNQPDVVKVIAVYESSTAGDPNLPSISLINRSAELTDTIQGELIVGDNSGATAQVVTKAAGSVDIVYTNDIQFETEEIVTFQSSGIVGQVSVVTQGDKEITKSFIFDDGQRPEFYDYARLIRKEDQTEPTKRLAIIFDHYILDGEVGDFASANSYSPDNYEFDMPVFSGIPLSDFIDARPRVKEYNLSSTTSPFDYDTRDFSVSGNKPPVIVGDDVVTIGYSHYLARVDKLFLSKDGFFELKKGAPAPTGDAVPPSDPAGAFSVATIAIQPYARNAKRASNIKSARHKRYTMADIGRLEKRVKNIEFYTQLSLLETDTASLTITDAKTGLDRFKSGFFVDNFRSHNGQALGNPLSRCSIDKKAGELRPSHYTHGLDLLLGSEQVIGIGTTADPAADLTQVSDLQSNDLKRSGDVVTLNYTEVPYISQPLATRTENVNPFAVITWIGGVELNPNSDVWLNENQLESNIVDIDAGFTQAMQQLAVDPNTGLAPIQWGGWEEVWSSTNLERNTIASDVNTTVLGSNTVTRRRGEDGHPGGDSRPARITTTQFMDQMVDTIEETITVDRGLTRSGIQFQVNESIDTQSLGNKLVSSELIPFMRSRNIEFVATRIQPRTQFYTFFDGQEVNKYVTPKLIEISMEQGVFQVGETITGISADWQTATNGNAASIKFRAAQPDHKFGAYNNPELVYAVNPYSDTDGVSSSYSATSSILNVDTGSLQQEVLGTFQGFISKNMILRGETSGAEAKVTDVRLISDEKGALIGSFFIPEASLPSAPEFRTGTNTFRLSSSAVDSRSPVDRASVAEATFNSRGTLNTLQEDVLSVRTADIQRQSREDSTTISNQSTNVFQQTVGFDNRTTEQVQWFDPLAESFEVTEANGIFVSSVDIFFQTKDDVIPVTCQIRTMQTGFPTRTIVPFGEVVMDPEQVNISAFGTIATRFTFPSPVFLEGGGGEYALTLISQSNEYNVFIAQMGEEDIADRNLQESERRIVSQQPYLGSLFKSQNGSTWTPSQFEDLKFIMNKCEFVPGPGALKLYNPEIGVGNKERPILKPNPIIFNSQEVKIQLAGNTSSSSTNEFPIGSRLIQVGAGASAEGNVVAHLGPLATATYQTGSGIGLTPASGNLTYSGIGLTSITGDGTGATANIAINSGTVNSVSVASGGSGYKTGDVLGASVGESGRNIRFTVGAVSNVNSVILNRVQGNFDTSRTLKFMNNTGISTNLNNGVPQSVTNTGSDKDGLHIHVSHRNHGMHAVNNKVTISGVIGISTVTTITEKYAHNATSAIKVSGISFLGDFEGLPVSATNPGYVQIGNEVIEYTAAASNELTGITRGVDNTTAETHEVGKTVRKYEAAGVSLRRINTTHNLIDSSIPPTIDGYHIKLNVTGTGNGITRDGTNALKKLKIAETEIGGGKVVRATQNIQFETFTPLVEFMVPSDTTLDGSIRTVSGTSVDGSEVSFADQGFESVSLSGITHLTTPRIIASKVNEQTQLTSLPGGKSFTQELVFNTQDKNVSPVVDLDRLSIITTTNRIDNPVSDYRTDSRVNSMFADPNAAIYITKVVQLENPATAIQVKFAAFRHNTNDIRVMYRLIRTDGVIADSPYELFPGFKNMTDTTGDGFGDQLIDAKNSDGTPDRFVPASRTLQEFRDYQFTANDLVEFSGFQIKVVMTGTNQAYVPRIRDFRSIALA